MYEYQCLTTVYANESVFVGFCACSAAFLCFVLLLVLLSVIINYLEGLTSDWIDLNEVSR